MFLYEVILPSGRSNRNWQAFYENVSRLNAKSPDHGGINNVVLLKHHMDKESVRVICGEKFKGRDREVEVNEITAASMKIPPHQMYTDLVNNLFLKYDNFPNL
jgi:hypothetical protein